MPRPPLRERRNKGVQSSSNFYQIKWWLEELQIPKFTPHRTRTHMARRGHSRLPSYFQRSVATEPLGIAIE